VWLVRGHLGLRLPRAVWLTLLAARYFAWRVACNVLLYLCQAASARIFAVGAPTPREWSRAGHFVALALACTVGALALLVDVALGLLLQLAVLLLALVPGARSVHHYMLLGLTEQARGRAAPDARAPAVCISPCYAALLTSTHSLALTSHSTLVVVLPCHSRATH
jgi:hypothetical protein